MVNRSRFALCILVVACKPETPGRPSLIDSDRVIAVRSIPAEVAPGSSSAPVQYDALYVGPGMQPDSSKLDWAFCTEQKPLAVTGPIAPSCLALQSPSLTSIGDGAPVSAEIPVDACSVFGPDPPAPEPGKPPSRPADPDTTGGYYQPVRLAVLGEEHDFSVGATRLDCGLGAATSDQKIEYARQHRPNENPGLDTLVTSGAGGSVTLPTDGTAGTITAQRNTTLDFTATWPTCPASAVCGDTFCSPGETAQSCPADCIEPAGCSGLTCQVHGCRGSEPYLALDPVAHQLVARHEAIFVSWFATDGSFDHDRTGRSEQDFETADTENRWTAPEAPGTVRLWLVFRDDRGGVGWSAFTIDVQ